MRAIRRECEGAFHAVHGGSGLVPSARCKLSMNTVQCGERFHRLFRHKVHMFGSPPRFARFFLVKMAQPPAFLCGQQGMYRPSSNEAGLRQEREGFHVYHAFPEGIRCRLCRKDSQATRIYSLLLAGQ